MTDTIPFDKLRFSIDTSGKTLITTDFLKTNFNPYKFFQGDSYKEGQRHVNMGLVAYSPELTFRVVDTTENSFEVIINEKSIKTALIKKEKNGVYYTNENDCLSDMFGSNKNKFNPKWYIFETWERYLRRVEFITKDSLVIFDKPNGEIIFENINRRFLPFKVVKVDGDWIKLEKDPQREFNFDNTKNYDGWTKWRQNNRILIRIFEHTYE